MSNFISFDPNYREKLVKKDNNPIYLPDFVRKIYPYIAKMSTLDMVIPQARAATLGSLVIQTYCAGWEACKSAKQTANHIFDRPFASAYKFTLESLPLISSSLHAKNLVNFMFFPQVSIPNPCKEINPENYKFGHEVDGREAMSKLLDDLDVRNCPEHAKILVSHDWKASEIQLLKDWDDTKLGWNTTQFTNVTAFESKIKKTKVALHPDKNRGDPHAWIYKKTYDQLDSAEKLLTGEIKSAQEQFQEKLDAGSISIPEPVGYQTLLADTALKAGFVWATTTSFFEKNVPGAQWLWPAFSTGTYVYTIGSNFLSLVRG